MANIKNDWFLYLENQSFFVQWSEEMILLFTLFKFDLNNKNLEYLSDVLIIENVWIIIYAGMKKRQSTIISLKFIVKYPLDYKI